MFLYFINILVAQFWA